MLALKVNAVPTKGTVGLLEFNAVTVAVTDVTVLVTVSPTATPKLVKLPAASNNTLGLYILKLLPLVKVPPVICKLSLSVTTDTVPINVPAVISATISFANIPEVTKVPPVTVIVVPVDAVCVPVTIKSASAVPVAGATLVWTPESTTKDSPNEIYFAISLFLLIIKEQR